MRLDEAGLGDYLFSHAEASPLRHETLTLYTVPSDGGDFQRYLRGEPAPDPEVGAAWREFLRSKARAGTPVGRVRVLYEKPSPYLLFEMEWLYTQNRAAGEQITVLDLTEVPRPAELVDDEFWMISDEDIVVMHYEPDGTFSAGETVEGAAIGRYTASAHAAQSAGRPFDQWWAEHPQYHRTSWLQRASV